MAKSRRAALGLLVLLVVLSVLQCARPEYGTPSVATPVSAIPYVRVGLISAARSVTLGGTGPLTLRTPDGASVGGILLGLSAPVVGNYQGLSIRVGDHALTPGPALEVWPADSGGTVRLNGREYRGKVMLSSAAGAVSAVNELDIEEYVEGVVGAEMGKRGEEDFAALKAQAVVSRTVAYKTLGRWRMRGYDLLATVADQVYSGTEFESDLGNRAVEETRGEILTYGGDVIDAFFHSTCGGRTAEGSEVFVGASRPYLRSISDVDGAGQPWCSLSPRFRWRESWTGAELERMLRETLPKAGGSTALATGIRDLRVDDRTPSGRVGHLTLVGASSSLTVTGPTARVLLHGSDGGLLRSANFTVQLTRNGARITQVVVSGSGAGHGVGMCQWGALGRSRAGSPYTDILSAYLPGTQISRPY